VESGQHGSHNVESSVPTISQAVVESGQHGSHNVESSVPTISQAVAESHAQIPRQITFGTVSSQQLPNIVQTTDIAHIASTLVLCTFGLYMVITNMLLDDESRTQTNNSYSCLHRIIPTRFRERLNWLDDTAVFRVSIAILLILIGLVITILTHEDLMGSNSRNQQTFLNNSSNSNHFFTKSGFPPGGLTRKLNYFNYRQLKYFVEDKDFLLWVIGLVLIAGGLFICTKAANVFVPIFRHTIFYHNSS
jgi:hypothetical protein